MRSSRTTSIKTSSRSAPYVLHDACKSHTGDNKWPEYPTVASWLRESFMVSKDDLQSWMQKLKKGELDLPAINHKSIAQPYIDAKLQEPTKVDDDEPKVGKKRPATTPPGTPKVVKTGGKPTF